MRALRGDARFGRIERGQAHHRSGRPDQRIEAIIARGATRRVRARRGRAYRARDRRARPAIVAQEFVVEPQAAEPYAVQEERALGVAHDEFGRSAADIEDARHAAAERVSAADAEVDQARLLDVVEYVDRYAASRADGREEFLAIRRFAHGGSRDRAHVARAGGARGLCESRDGRALRAARPSY